MNKRWILMALDLLCKSTCWKAPTNPSVRWTASPRAWKASGNKAGLGQTTLALVLSQPVLNESPAVMSLRHMGLLLSKLSSWICEKFSVTLLKLQQFSAWTCWTPMWFFRSPPEPLKGIVEEYFNNFAGCNENCNICLLHTSNKNVCLRLIFTSKWVTWPREAVTPRLIFFWSPGDLARASKSLLVHGIFSFHSWDKCPGNLPFEFLTSDCRPSYSFVSLRWPYSKWTWPLVSG